MTEDSVTSSAEPSKSQLAARKAADNTIGSVCVCSAFMFLGGSLWGAAWPAAVAVCGLSVMGAIVGYFQLRKA